jgi:hypothetical protein
VSAPVFDFGEFCANGFARNGNCVTTMGQRACFVIDGGVEVAKYFSMRSVKTAVEATD